MSYAIVDQFKKLANMERPRFSYRKEIRALSRSTLDSDVIIIDRARPHLSSTSWNEIEECEALLVQDGRYSLVFDENDLKVYSRKPFP